MHPVVKTEPSEAEDMSLFQARTQPMDMSADYPAASGPLYDFPYSAGRLSSLLEVKQCMFKAAAATVGKGPVRTLGCCTRIDRPRGDVKWRLHVGPPHAHGALTKIEEGSRMLPPPEAAGALKGLHESKVGPKAIPSQVRGLHCALVSCIVVVSLLACDVTGKGPLRCVTFGSMGVQVPTKPASVVGSGEERKDADREKEREQQRQRMLRRSQSAVELRAAPLGMARNSSTGDLKKLPFTVELTNPEGQTYIAGRLSNEERAQKILRWEFTPCCRCPKEC